MPYDFTYVESNEQNKLTKYTQTKRYREQIDSYQRGGDWGEKVKGIKKKHT